MSMNMNTLNKLLDDKEIRKLLLESTEKHLEYIKNYKSVDERCDEDCCYNCDDCKEEEEIIDDSFCFEDGMLETLCRVGNMYDLKVSSFNNEDNGQVYITFKPL